MKSVTRCVERFYYAVRRKLSYWKQVCLLCMPGPRNALNRIVEVLEGVVEPELTDFAKVSAIRNWVNENSIHLIDDEHDQYAFNLPRVAQKIWGYFVSKGAPPHLSCGPRSYLFKELLDRMGFETRIIDILEITRDGPRSHTLVEYFDRSLGKWVMQDPDFNACYVNVESQLPMGAKECVASLGGNVTYDTSGYKVESLKNLEGTIEDYFLLVIVYRYCYVGGRAVFQFSDSAEEYVSEHGMALVDFYRYLSRRYNGA